MPHAVRIDPRLHRLAARARFELRADLGTSAPIPAFRLLIEAHNYTPFSVYILFHNPSNLSADIDNIFDNLRDSAAFNVGISTEQPVSSNTTNLILVAKT